MRQFFLLPICVFAFSTAACVQGGQAPVASAATPRPEKVSEQIISGSAAGSARELFERGDRALTAGRYQEAKDQLETLTLAWKQGSTEEKAELEAPATFDLAMAYEGLGQRTSARDTYADIEKRFSPHPLARAARARLFSVHAYLEEWKELEAAAERALAESTEAGDRMAALAARALSRIERGDEEHASRDVQDGLDIMEEHHVGEGGRLPASAAMLKFALGEVRRTRSEKVSFAAPDAKETTATDLVAFMPKMELRCQGLMAAQNAYADAMRALDPFFVAFGAFRVGEMYKALHHDLMAIPPTSKAKTNEQRDLFFAMMHVRYRVLLQKADDMMKRTLSMAPAGASARDPDFAAWLARAALAKKDIERALEEEAAVLAKLPYNEGEVKRALELMEQKVLKQQEEREKKEFERNRTRSAH